MNKFCKLVLTVAFLALLGILLLTKAAVTETLGAHDWFSLAGYLLIVITSIITAILVIMECERR